MTTSTFISAHALSHSYGKVRALDEVSLEFSAVRTVAVIGPDGVGKSTLLALIAGARAIQQGQLSVLGGDVRSAAVRRMLQQRVAYMPQGLGRNLYADLSIAENLEFFGRLYGHSAAEIKRRSDELLAATGLLPFAARPVKQLSGGMKQKLGLCCALIHDPDLLVLDEPTTGVDPLSRQQFWQLIERIGSTRPNLKTLVATSYMEEAERFDQVVMMNAGRVLAVGSAALLKQQTGAETLEAAFIAFLPPAQRGAPRQPEAPAPDLSHQPIAIEAKNLTRRFGDFVAVDHVNFSIRRGEIFGFLGSNGCGKTTTMKMLTGLLPPSEGSSQLFGQVLNAEDLNNRRRIGYMSQSFSLYGELTVEQNLQLHGKLFQLPEPKLRERLAWIYDRFNLAPYRDQNSGRLPLGVRQRLSLAVAILHEPEILILDEPTSGVDPVARDDFWTILTDLVRNHGVTIFISTHFMSEAVRCTRISLMHAGKVLATGTPHELCAARHAATLEAAFISYISEVDGDVVLPDTIGTVTATAGAAVGLTSRFSLQRLLAYTRRETLELLRDPIRLLVATLGFSLLMLVFGYGITLDVNNLRYAVLDQDQSPESRSYIESFAGSPYFQRMPDLQSFADADAKMRAGSIAFALSLPPDFGRHLRRGENTEISAILDGAMPFRAETAAGYVQGVHQRFLAQWALAAPLPLTMEPRFRYNQSFQSIHAIVPGVAGLLLIFIPAILAVLSVVREKEMGSIANLYVTPTTRLEFILGKQIPYIIFSFASFLIMLLMTVIIFGIAVKGSLLGLLLGAFIYIIVTTGYGLLISSFTESQIAALAATAITCMIPATQFSGLLQPVSTLEGPAYWIGTFFPTTYFIRVSVGTLTKGLEFFDVLPFIAQTSLFIPVLLTATVLLSRKQEV